MKSLNIVALTEALDAIFILRDLNEGSLANKHLVDVEQDVAALNNHPLDRQVLANVLRLGHLQQNGNITGQSFRYLKYMLGIYGTCKQVLFLKCVIRYI